MNLAVWLERTARAMGETPAIFAGETLVATYAQFFARASGLARGLRDNGVTPGDRVAIFAKNTPEYLIAFYGIWIAGAVAVPINAKLHAKEAAWIIEDAKASVVLATPELVDDLQATGVGHVIDLLSADFAQLCRNDPMPVAARAAQDLCWLFYTSGTTGRPKGVRITHAMVMAASLSYPMDVDDVQQRDAALYAAPMSHGAGLYMAIHVARGAAHLVPVSGSYAPAEVLKLSAWHGSVSMFLAPTMVKRLLEVAQAADNHGVGIKTIVYGGGPMYVSDIVAAVDWFGPKFVQIYGQGECPMCISALSRGDVADRSHPHWQTRLGSVGRAQSVVEVAIEGAQGPGDIGEIMVRGAPVMTGYWNNDAASAKAMRDGWLMTGDVGHLDSDGFLTLVDRSKDLIISGGTNIYPREVEEILLQHPEVSEVSVIGRASKEWGEDVVAFVVGACSEADLNRYCLENIARFKRPKAYVFVPDLPKNNYGKVLKTELRKRLS